MPIQNSKRAHDLEIRNLFSSVEKYFTRERSEHQSSHERHRKARFLYVTIATVIFSLVKIACFAAKVHLVFHWCLYNNKDFSFNSLYLSLAFSNPSSTEYHLMSLPHPDDSYKQLLKPKLRISNFQHFHWFAGHRLSVHKPAFTKDGRGTLQQ